MTTPQKKKEKEECFNCQNGICAACLQCHNPACEQSSTPLNKCFNLLFEEIEQDKENRPMTPGEKELASGLDKLFEEESDWEEEFDKQFPAIGEYSYPDHDIPANHGEEGQCISCPIEARGDINEDVKIFIHTLLSSKRDEMLKGLRKLKQDTQPKEEGVPVETYGYEENFNQALTEAEEIIKQIMK